MQKFLFLVKYQGSIAKKDASSKLTQRGWRMEYTIRMALA